MAASQSPQAHLPNEPPSKTELRAQRIIMVGSINPDRRLRGDAYNTQESIEGASGR